MKKFLAILFVAFLSCTVMSAQSALFKKYENVKGVSTVYISKALLGLVPKLEAGDMDISAVASKLDHVQVLTCERPSLIKEIKTTAVEILSKGGYNNLMTVRDGDELTIIYGKQLGKGKNEFVLLEVEKDEITVVNISGSISLEDIKRIADD